MIESAKILKKRGSELLMQPIHVNVFTGKEEVDVLLNNIADFPHAFVLACLMDRQIKAERAWKIPHTIKEIIGSFEISALLALELYEIEQIFEEHGLHRFNSKMANVFFLALQHIHKEYKGNAANIWSNNPSSARIVRRFLEFYGAGIKIATMATNMLAREFKIPMSDYTSIDISPDVHIKRVFTRLGYIRPNADGTEIIYAARELNPEYPGVFDLSVWEVGRNWCRPSNPLCTDCYLQLQCPKQTVTES